MAARRVKQVTSLDLAKHLSSKLCRIVERRDRQVEKATSAFRLEMLAALDDADDETIDLVQRGLKHDGGSQFLRLALQTALDERARATQTRRSGDIALTGADAAAIMRDAPPPRFEVGPDSDDAPLVISTPEQATELLGSSDAGDAARAILADGPDEGELRYPEPGEPAVTLPDGRVVAAP